MKIEEIAKDIRDRMEEYAKENSLASDLGGLCAIASAALAEALNKMGYVNVYFVKGTYHFNQHCWVECNNKIIDLTATQFSSKASNDYSPIYLTSYDQNKNYKAEKKYLANTSNIKNGSYVWPEEIKNCGTPWPYEQQPRKCLIEKIVKL